MENDAFCTIKSLVSDGKGEENPDSRNAVVRTRKAGRSDGRRAGKRVPENVMERCLKLASYNTLRFIDDRASKHWAEGINDRALRETDEMSVSGRSAFTSCCGRWVSFFGRKLARILLSTTLGSSHKAKLDWRQIGNGRGTRRQSASATSRRQAARRG